ncbi:MAG TPA: replicative DNA helicase [Phycisphaerales bacterium]|nr:replicative DNA helicase [Phycisphaerales bacterium]
MDATAPTNGRSRRNFNRLEQVSVKDLFDRQPPQALEAEMSLLGSIILDPGVIPDVISLIKGAGDFYKVQHAEIYKAVLDVYDQRNTGDLVQIVDLLRDRNVLDQVGGADYLVELANCVPTAVNAPHFARIVAEKAKLRRLIDAAGQILYDAYHVGELGPEGAREVLDKAEMAVFEIAQESSTADPQSLADLLQIEIDRIMVAERDGWPMTGVKSGYTDLDDLLRGFQPGELIILAARPSMGKTAFSLNLAEQIAMGGTAVLGAPPTNSVPVGFFSLEMSKNAIVQRLISARSGVSSQHLRGGHSISKADLDRLGQAADDLKHAPIYIDDMPSMTVLTLRARARRMVAQYGVKVIMIDYLQLMTAPGAARESRQVEVSTISRGVKALARELNVPVICLAQLNRASEQREGNRPRMADLRESGSIEQDADVILLLHREDYYHVQDEQWKIENPDKVGVAEIIVAKQRNGPTDIVKLMWDSKTTRFKNLDQHSQPPGGYPFDDVGYSSPSQAAAKFPAGPGKGAIEAKPWTQAFTPPPFDADPPPAPAAPRPSSAFGARPKTGPAENHRDGGGSDQRPVFEEEEGL